MSDDNVVAKIRRLIADALTPRSGPTAQRPVVQQIGYQYFDTTLGKPVWLKTGGETPVWVDAAGTTV